MLHDVLELAKQELRLPRIIDERCVHSLIENATCDRCVEACPRNAWQLDDEMLGIDTRRCDGCGLCAPACTEGALLHEHQLLVRYWKNRRVAFRACELAGLDDATDVIPCLHGSGLSDLLHLYKQGCTSIIATSGDCNHCGRKPTVSLDDVLQQVNKWLMSRDLPLMRLQSLEPVRWNALLKKTRPEASGRGFSRRAFLSQTVRGSVLGGVRLAGFASTGQQDEFLPPGRLLPDGPAGQLMPVVPSIDTARCDGCDACAVLCPHEAISLDKDEHTACYSIDARNCTGCGICADVCEQQAISLAYNTPSQQTSVNLHPARCKRCGVTFHSPAEQHDDTGLCRICTRVNHHRNLFQVFD